ncbi:CoA ester lyase [Nonomuraea sp. NPDC046570]|uniref:HpcH/HpaI aldolase/citrate lyase family protein n=1 Tax=Nonomuraea sp. NPDC046570 TaxID=3155255 RepID=UPI0033DDA6F6
MTLPITWLYVPGDRPDRYGKAVASGADVVILDLEDAVAPARKDDARRAVAEFLARRGPEGGPALHVRINDLATRRGLDDLAELAAAPGLDALRLPKVESPQTLDLADEILGDRPVGAYALLESALGVLGAEAIAAHPRVAGLALGEQDLAAELSITAEHAFDHLRLRVVLAAAAAGLPPVPMSVYADLKDTDGLIASCVRGRALGMLGRAAIHPRQLPAIRQGFRPASGEVAKAREVVEAAERARAAGVGAVALPDGRFVDAPVVTRARRTLALAEEA